MASYTPRVTNLTKRDGQSFGFMLRAELGEDGHLIRSLDKGGLAELAGLRDADRILRVNNIFVDNLNHVQVVKMVKESGSSVTLHILDQTSYKRAKASGVDLSDPQPRPTMNGMAGTGPKPKLCFLVKSKAGFEFTLKSTEGEKGVFISDVTTSGVADKAGVKAQDRLLEVNGENVGKATHEQIVQKIKAAGSHIMFLLVDEETDRHYKSKNLKPGVGQATTKHLPHKPRIANMTKGSDGYGFYLRSDPKLKGHFVKDIDSRSPADKVGLKDMDRIVAVDGDATDRWNHDQLVERIRRCGERCSMLVVDSETDSMYKLGGASPILYWEEMKGTGLQPTPPPSPKATPKPITVPTPAHEKPSSADYKPKLCKLEKTPNGYGFHLNGIRGQIGNYAINEVAKGGAADKAGLEDGDIVIEVEGVNVEEVPYEDVVDMIKASGDRLVLLVTEKRVYDHLKAQQIAITTLLLARNSLEEPRTPTRLQEVKEEEEEEEEKGKKEERAEEKKEEETPRPATPTVPAEVPERKSSVASASSEASSEDAQL
ncbi:hypothetical protein AGOR_G00219230 [Albula goreensis]|uniref:PDZ domain-containing protein n=1 Tax=Albula goreensis TaxID=1534307 RepID=A0A8T3CNG1_9TELE|nr:hypothetical protein AGOR_G00219230 [Albula goreensis]